LNSILLSTKKLYLVTDFVCRYEFFFFLFFKC